MHHSAQVPRTYARQRSSSLVMRDSATPKADGPSAEGVYNVVGRGGHAGGEVILKIRKACSILVSIGRPIMFQVLLRSKVHSTQDLQ